MHAQACLLCAPAQHAFPPAKQDTSGRYLLFAAKLGCRANSKKCRMKAILTSDDPTCSLVPVARGVAKRRIARLKRRMNCLGARIAIAADNGIVLDRDVAEESALRWAIEVLESIYGVVDAEL